ncbi:hypothetical protein FOA52_005910, partial [Chlamydomonas sp. UWO 241]
PPRPPPAGSVSVIVYGTTCSADGTGIMTAITLSVDSTHGIQAPTGMVCSDVEGGLVIQVSFMLQSDSMAFYESVTSAPGMAYFIDNNRATGNLPCNAIISVVDDSTQRTAYFSCIAYTSALGQVSTIIPELCCTAPSPSSFVSIVVFSDATSCAADGAGLVAAIKISVSASITQGMQPPTNGGLVIQLYFSLESDSSTFYNSVASEPGITTLISNARAVNNLPCNALLIMSDSGTRNAQFSCAPIAGLFSIILPVMCCAGTPSLSYVSMIVASPVASCTADGTGIMAAITLSVGTTQGIQAPTSMATTCSDVGGRLIIWVSSMLQSDSTAFFESFTSTPGMTCFIGNSHATSVQPCDAIILVFDHSAQRLAQFICSAMPGSTILPELCCAA